MHADRIVAQISQELLSFHHVHTILLYGSRADGSAGPDSDYDIAAFGTVAQTLRVARLESGSFWDIFIYPESLLLNPSEEYLKLRGSVILIQRDSQAETFLRRLDEIFIAGPSRMAEDEASARKLWAHKMIARIERGDAEGNYRRAWLLQALLEDYFHLRGYWYQGPKKSLRWLEQFDPSASHAFCVALEPGAGNESIATLVRLVVGLPDAERMSANTATSPNKAPEPTPTSVTSRAISRVAE